MPRRQREDVDPLLKLSQEEFSALLQRHAATLNLQIGMDGTLLSASTQSPLAQDIEVFGRRISNRLAIHPTEGWDANFDGSPSDWVLNRWRNFGLSGSQLIWGGEAHALYQEIRANPRQTCAFGKDESLRRMSLMRQAALEGRKLVYGDENIVLGLQLTHSGIFSMPYPGGGRNSVPAQSNPHPVKYPFF